MNTELTPIQIRNFRLSKGFSQRDLAKLIGVRQATVSDWEKGKRKPSPLATKKIEVEIDNNVDDKCTKDKRVIMSNVNNGSKIKWAYWVRRVSKHDDEIIEDVLCQATDENWELVTVIDRRNEDNGWITFYFKRPLKAGEKIKRIKNEFAPLI